MVQFVHKTIIAFILANILGCSYDNDTVPPSPLDGNWLFVSTNQQAFAELSIHSNKYYLVLMVQNSPNTAQAIGEVGNLIEQNDHTLIFVPTKSSCPGLITELADYHLLDQNTLNIDIGYLYTLDGMKKCSAYPPFNFQINFGCFNYNGDFVLSIFSL